MFGRGGFVIIFGLLLRGGAVGAAAAETTFGRRSGSVFRRRGEGSQAASLVGLGFEGRGGRRRGDEFPPVIDRGLERIGRGGLGFVGTAGGTRGLSASSAENQ